MIEFNEQQKQILLQCLNWIEDGPVGWEAIRIGDAETCSTEERCEQFFADVKDIKNQLE